MLFTGGARDYRSTENRKKRRGGGAGLGQMEIQADINLDLALTNVTISTRGVQGALHRLNR